MDAIVNIGQDTIDMNQVVRVGSTGGDSAWRRYTVYLSTGVEFEIFEEREYADNKKLPTLPREKFIELWKKSKTNDNS